MKSACKGIVVLLAVWTAGAALYGLISSEQQSSVSLRMVTVLPWAGYAHIVCGSLALILGALQLSSRLRRRSLSTHKVIGNTYVACVLISTIGAIGGLPLSNAPTSAIAGFWLLAVVWPIVTLAGYPWKQHFDPQWHGRLMIYSYALTCAAITLRLILIPLLMSGVAFQTAYPIAAWGGGIGNLLIAFAVLKWTEMPQQTVHGDPSV